MAPIEKQKKLLSDLIRINYERIEGYEKAATQSYSQPQLASTLRRFANDSRKNINEIKSHLRNDGFITDSYHKSFFKSWIDFKSALCEIKKSVLDLCYFGDGLVLKVYDKVLQETEELNFEGLKFIKNQRSIILTAQDRLLTLRSEIG